MFKSALRVFVSFCVIAVAAPGHAEGATARPQRHKKVAPKRVAAASHGKVAKRVPARPVKHKTEIRRVTYKPPAPAVPPVMTAGDLAGLNATHDPLALRSNAAVVVDPATAQVLFEKNANVALPIASLTKLMTATVVLDAHQDMDEVLEVTEDDVDHEKHSASRLRVGSRMSRANMLHIALMSSENRAASALGRNYPGGLPAFVAAMNAKAKALGMNDTHYVEPTGLSSQNVASARDLARLVAAASQYSLIRRYSTDDHYMVNAGGYALQYVNSNRLVMSRSWDIALQKTGFINEAGHCLVMQAKIEGHPVVMVFLDSKGKDSRLADAGRVRKWLETSKPQIVAHVPPRQS